MAVTRTEGLFCLHTSFLPCESRPAQPFLQGRVSEWCDVCLQVYSRQQLLVFLGFCRSQVTASSEEFHVLKAGSWAAFLAQRSLCLYTPDCSNCLNQGTLLITLADGQSECWACAGCKQQGVQRCVRLHSSVFKLSSLRKRYYWSGFLLQKVEPPCSLQPELVTAESSQGNLQ